MSDWYNNGTGKIMKEVPVSQEEIALDGEIPFWGVADFFNDRVNWQKSLTSLAGEPSFLYFKIFFKFDTNQGLFGSIKNGTDNNGNSAISYLISIAHCNKMLMINDRMRALYKFTNLLSFISSSAPWFFMSLKGIDEASQVYMDGFSKKKSITIDCMQDAIDLRIETLMDLYKFACFDMNTFREIIPQNLRCFDMTVLVMNVPLKYYQTGFQFIGGNGRKNNTSFENKKTSMYYGDDISQTMSFNAFVFKNCEFDLESMRSQFGNMNNEKPFQPTAASIKINYQRCYQQQMNEFQQMLFGYNGFMYDGDTPEPTQVISDYFKRMAGQSTMFRNIATNKESQDERLRAISEGRELRFNSNFSSTQYRALVEASENILNDAMLQCNNGYALGNLYDRQSQFIDQQDNTNRLSSIGAQIRGLVDAPKRIADNAANNWNKLKSQAEKFMPKNIAAGFMEGFNGEYARKEVESAEEFSKKFNSKYKGYTSPTFESSDTFNDRFGNELNSYREKNNRTLPVNEDDDTFIGNYAKRIEEIRKKNEEERKKQQHNTISFGYEKPSESNLFGENGIQSTNYEKPFESQLYKQKEIRLSNEENITGQSDKEYNEPFEKQLYDNKENATLKRDGDILSDNVDRQYNKPFEKTLYTQTNNRRMANTEHENKVETQYNKPQQHELYQQPIDENYDKDSTLTKKQRILRQAYDKMWNKHDMGNLWK